MFDNPLIKAGDCNIESRQVRFLITLTPVSSGLGEKINKHVEDSASLMGLGLDSVLKNTIRKFPACCFASDSLLHCVVHPNETYPQPVVFTIGLN